MRVTQIRLKDFRNYREQAVEFCPRINILEGNNAQGKTNLVEAVRYLSIGKSPRTVKERELIRWDAGKAHISADVEKAYGSDTLDAVIDKKLPKSISINKMPITRMGELMGMLTTVMFSPDEIGIIKDSPASRRRFIDIALCQISKAYFYLLNRYNKILAQRNRLLKEGRTDAGMLDIWDTQLAGEGAKIVKTRLGFLNRLQPYAIAAHSFLTDNKEQFALSYDGLDIAADADIKQVFLDELKRTRNSDMTQGFTHVGPQRDDLKVTADGVDLRVYGSQGQQRTAALTLKLAELELMREETGEYPVLLLDDVLSELDEGRQYKLMEKIADFQTVITCTHIPESLKSVLSDTSRVLKVRAGVIEG